VPVFDLDDDEDDVAGDFFGEADPAAFFVGDAVVDCFGDEVVVFLGEDLGESAFFDGDVFLVDEEEEVEDRMRPAATGVF